MNVITDDNKTILTVTHEKNPLRIGDVEIACAVLEGGIRVISLRAVTKALGRSRPKGGQKGGGVEMPYFLAADNLKPFISNDLRGGVETTMVYNSLCGGMTYGIPADLLTDICEVFLKARDAGPGVLHHTQISLAQNAEKLMRGLAKVGIRALVDECTGYQEVRPKDDLQSFLDLLITDKYTPWITRKFPRWFFKELSRITGISIQNGTPGYFGYLINELVYDRLGNPEVTPTLQSKNPRNPETGRRPRCHWQHLTTNFGIPVLDLHFATLKGLMQHSTNLQQLIMRCDGTLPKAQGQQIFWSFAKFEDTLPNGLELKINPNSQKW